MEDNTEPTETSTLQFALILLAILLGGVGLYFGLTAKQQPAPLKKSAAEDISSSARTNKQLSKIDKRINELSAQNVKLKETIQRLGRKSLQTLREAKQAYAGVQSNSGELIELAKNISLLATSGAAPIALSPRVEVRSYDSEKSVIRKSSSSLPTLTYKIQYGETFGKIASQKGVRLDALIEANQVSI